MEKQRLLKIKQFFLRLITWIKQNPIEFCVLIFILLIGAFLRLYKIDQYMTFLGDEGRDAIIVRRLLVDADPILVGPGTSIGNMYLGPLYYYMMAPALFLAGLSPVGPAIQVALLGVATILLIWLIAKEWFGLLAALVASLFYAISPTVIIYSRSSWNPNIMPFFALVCIYAIWSVWKKRQFKWLIVLGISYAFVLQSHYLGLLLAPTIFIFYLFTFLKLKLEKKEGRCDQKAWNNFWSKSLLSLLIFLLLMSPLVIFDARHDWRNFLSMKKFFTERQTTVSAKPWTAIPKIPDVIKKISTRLLAGKNENIGKWILAIISIPSLILVLIRKDMKENELSGYTVILVWLFAAIIGLGVYKQEVYDHYYGFFFPAPFLLIGGFVEAIMNNLNRIGQVLLWLMVILLLIPNLLENPLRYSPNMQLQRSADVAEKIKIESGGLPFNLAVIAERNYEDGYQYFLEMWELPVVDIDAQRAEETIKDQLFVACEVPKEECNAPNSPKAEVANFGWSKVVGEWEVSGVTLYKLVHLK